MGFEFQDINDEPIFVPISLRLSFSCDNHETELVALHNESETPPV